MNKTRKHFRIKKERIALIQLFENLTFDEKKQILKKVNQSMVDSANKLLAEDNPPSELLTKFPNRFTSEVQAKVLYMGRNLLIRGAKNELFKEKRKKNIKPVKYFFGKKRSICRYFTRKLRIMKKAEVKFENITKKFNETVAVDNVSCIFEAGTLTTLLGPSGCGKTTSLRIIAGLERATEGKILVDNEDVLQLIFQKIFQKKF